MTKSPATPPKPRQINRPLAQPKPEREARPLTAKLMARANRIIERSKGAITKKTLAEYLETHPQNVIEWLGGWRSAPNGETVLRIEKWVLKHEAKA